jgi:hypothetical protein
MKQSDRLRLALEPAAGDGSTTRNHCHFCTPSALLHSRRSACRISSSPVGLAQKARWKIFTGSFSISVGGSPFHATIDGLSTDGLRRASSQPQSSHNSSAAAMTARIKRSFLMSWTGGHSHHYLIGARKESRDSLVARMRVRPQVEFDIGDAGDKTVEGVLLVGG